MPKTSNPIRKLKTLVSNGLATAKKVARAENSLNNRITSSLGLSKKNAKAVLAGTKSLTALAKKGAKKKRRAGAINFPDKDTMAATCIHKREFVCFVNGSTGFVSNSQPVSLQNTFMFPWGSQVLPQYEMYHLRNLHFHFESTYPNITTGGSLGVLIMGIVYDPDDPTINDISTMLNYQGFGNKRVDKSWTVKWDPRHNPLPTRYVAHNPNANPFNDSAIFYWATNGNPNTNQIGEIWVEYDIELYVPRPSIIPNYQVYNISSTTTAAGTYHFMDANLAGTVNSYGQAFTTLTRAAATSVKINFNVPGFYLLVYSMGTAGGVVTSAVNDSNTSHNVTAFANPTGNGDYFNTLVMKFASGTVGPDLSGMGHNTIWVDVSTNYVQGSTDYTDGGFFTYTGTATANVHTLWIFRVPKPTSTAVPILPEISRVREEMDELKKMIAERYEPRECVGEERFLRLERLTTSDSSLAGPNPPPTPVHSIANWVGYRSNSHK